MTSLRKNLLLSTAATLAVFFLVMCGLMFFTIKRVGEHQRFYHLLHDAEAVGEALVVTPGEPIAIDQRLIESVYKLPGSGHYYTIYQGDQPRIGSPSLEGEFLPHHATSEPWLLGVDKIRVLGRESIIVEHHVATSAGGVDVVVAEEIEDLVRETRENVLFGALFSLPFLFGIMLIQKIAISRSLRPFDTVRRQVEQIDAGLATTITGNELEELVPLVNQINHLVTKASQRLERSRNALGNLAHALKTPLAAIVSEVRSKELADETRTNLERNARLIHEKIDHELKKARISGPGSVGRIRIRSDVEDLGYLLRKIYADRRVSIHLTTDEVECRVDRQDFLELLGNIADNACKWAHEEVRIAIGLKDNGRTLEICVDDDGPGCDEDTMGALGTARGLRLDESCPGHGIGLAVCREIAADYRGTLEFSCSPALGGLRVICRLPLDSQGAPPKS